MIEGSLTDPIGHRFGLLTSVALIEDRLKGHVTSVLFRCDCGQLRKVSIRTIRDHRVPTGCNACEKQQPPDPEPEKIVIPALRFLYPSEYGTWRRDKSKFCKRWKGRRGFEWFMRDMGPRPPGLALCRKNRKKWHGPKNSYWGRINTDSA